MESIPDRTEIEVPQQSVGSRPRRQANLFGYIGNDDCSAFKLDARELSPTPASRELWWDIWNAMSC